MSAKKERRRNIFFKMWWDWYWLYLFDSLLAFLNLWLMPCVHEVSKCRTRVFEFWSNFAFELFPKWRKSDQRVPHGGQTRSKGVPPNRFEKQVANKNAPRWESAKQLAPKWDPTLENLAYLGKSLFMFLHISSRMLFRCFFRSFEVQV